MEIRPDTKIIINASDLRCLSLSVPDWHHLTAPPANQGYVRHGVSAARSCIPAAYKHAYATHAAPFMGDGSGPLLLWGTRNSVQNLFLPLFHAQREPALLCRADEPWESTGYEGLVRFGDGRVAIEALRFVAGGSHATHAVEIRNGQDRWERRDDVEFAVVGQPILWAGELPSLRQLAAATYDLRHLWHMLWEDWQECPEHAAVHDELMETLMANLHAAPEWRGAALCAAAARHKLMIEDGYLHSSLGLDTSGNLILIARRGSLAELGRAQRRAGASRAILLDNGGSVGYCYVEPTGAPHFFGNSSYFRPRAHALLVAELKERYIEPAFRPRPNLDALHAISVSRPGSTLITDIDQDIKRWATRLVTVLYDDPHGSNRADLPRVEEGENAEAYSTAFAAVTIHNHVVLYGTRRVYLRADSPFVEEVCRVFKERFDSVMPGYGVASGAVSDYLSVLNAPETFHISSASGFATLVDSHVGIDAAPHDLPAEQLPRTAVGVDIGSRSTKFVLLHDGNQVAERTMPTRPLDREHTLASLIDMIQEVITGFRGSGAVAIDAVGIAWPGAVCANRIAGTSSLLRGMADLTNAEGQLEAARFESIRPFGSLVCERLENHPPVYLINDGNVVAFYAARKHNLRRALIAQLGTSIAGGYVDAQGRCDYLAEVGRFVLDLAPDAPWHAFTRIHGVARELVSSRSLRRLLINEGLEHFRGKDVTEANAGEIAGQVLSEPRYAQEKKRVQAALGTLANYLAHLLIALTRHFPTDHILLSGGPLVPSSPAGQFLRIQTQDLLNRRDPETARKLVDTPVDRSTGAIAAAFYALQRASLRG